MSNTSATGGYLSQTEQALPGGLTLNQFIQQVLVNLTGITGTLVRPKWQKNMPKQPPLPETNWLAFGVDIITPDANAYTETQEDGETTILERNEFLSITCSFYGADCSKNAAILRDAFQVQQNRVVLLNANMNFTEASQITTFNELHGEIWFPRSDITINLVRGITKTFEILDYVAAEGEALGEKSNDEIEVIPIQVLEE